MAENRDVGGLFCFEVLAQLSDYVDGELGAEARAKIDGHLQGCDACAQFGGEFGAVVKALQQKVRGEEPSAGAQERLLARLPVR